MYINHIPSKTKISHKKALVCYIPDSYNLPLDHPNFFGHSNFQECRTLLDCLTEQGFSCDVIGFQENARSLIGSNYDLLIAIRDQLEYGKALVKTTGRVIMYSTACHWTFHNSAEYNRINQLRDRKGLSLKPRRQHTPVLFEDQVDEIWYFGNDFQQKTYAHINAPKYPINISIIPTSIPPKSIFTDENRRHFLWFGSVGSVHKGLDWLLDIFSRNPDLHLHVCGLVEKEEDFFSAFRKELLELPNIHFHGWALPTSDKFREVSEKCGFIVSPSCSEGCSGAVLQCMSVGMIPLISKANGIAVQNAGFILGDSIEETEKTLLHVSQMSQSDLLARSLQAQQYVQNNHTLSHYKSSILAKINKIVNMAM
jgi:glycosyltransferase involved in cell wall biosynthesis